MYGAERTVPRMNDEPEDVEVVCESVGRQQHGGTRVKADGRHWLSGVSREVSYQPHPVIVITHTHLQAGSEPGSEPGSEREVSGK